MVCQRITSKRIILISFIILVLAALYSIFHAPVWHVAQDDTVSMTDTPYDPVTN